MTRKLILLSALVFLATGCTFTDKDLTWPEKAYPQEYFINVFQADEAAQQYQTQEDYLLWITRFYEGNNLTVGWIGLTEQLLERIESEEHRAEVKERVNRLGAKIGSEWAKDNLVRKLDTRNAAVWRDALREAVDRGEVDDYITRVENDVESMLAGELKVDDVYFERYYYDEFD